MPRVNVVTGAASGIGLAMKQVLEERGETVIGVDIRDADVLVDLTSPHDRERMVKEVEARSGGSIDTIIAVAGLAAPARWSLWTAAARHPFGATRSGSCSRHKHDPAAPDAPG